MNANSDALSDADKWFDETGRYYLANGHLESALKAAFNDGLATNKPEPQDHDSELEQRWPNAVTPEPQAQAGEPSGLSCHQLEVQRDHWQERCIELSDVIAKKDAALKACVEALGSCISRRLPFHHVEQEFDESKVCGAITQAQGALK